MASFFQKMNNDTFPYLEAYLGFKTFMFLFESYLDYRQFQKTRESTIPAAAKELTTQGAPLARDLAIAMQE
eukprot:gene977-361_t